MKPTYGLVPYTGGLAIDISLDHAGPMAKTVADCALLLEVDFYFKPTDLATPGSRPAGSKIFPVAHAAFQPFIITLPWS